MKRKKLISKRRDNSWNQEELATKVGTTQQSISLIENGKRDPSIRLAKKFELVFNEPMEKLFPDIFLSINTTKCDFKIKDKII